MLGWVIGELGSAREGRFHTGISVLVVSTSPQLLEKAQEQEARYGHHQYLALPCDLNDLVATMDEMIGSA